MTSFATTADDIERFAAGVEAGRRPVTGRPRRRPPPPRPPRCGSWSPLSALGAAAAWWGSAGCDARRRRGLWRGLAAAAAIVGASAPRAVGPRLHYARWRWELTDEGLELSHGVVLRVESAIPTFRVQQIDVRQGPLERAFGLVKPAITTASSASDGTLPGIEAERAEEIRRLLLGRVAADDGV